MENVKNKKLVVVLAGVVLAIACLIPAMAHANSNAGYPGVDQSTFTGTTAQTQVGLKIDESQLSFTAPSVINFAMDEAGEFITPDPGVAKIKNNSVFNIKVVKYDIVSATGTKGMADVTGATDNNAYQVNIKPGTGTAIPFAISQSTLGTDWVIGHGSGSDELGLSFSNGKMVNIQAGRWGAGDHLQTATWTVSAA